MDRMKCQHAVFSFHYGAHQGRAETFGGAGAQSIKGAHGKRLLIELCPLLICVSKWMLLCWYSSKCHDVGLKKETCHRSAGVSWPATRCLCMSSTWLVVCCCWLPSWYPIIVSVAPPVSPSFISLFSLLVSVVLCWSVVFRCVCVCYVDYATVLCLPACLPVFPLRGGFCYSVSFYD